MSRVFVATEVTLGRRVVLKVLPPDLAAVISPDRFRREIQLAARLQHPHIVPLLTADVESPGTAGQAFPWYTMPFIEGESLRARLRREGELPIPEAVRLLRDLAEALAYAHAHGVAHRDIKPDNLLLSAGHLLVADFGIAKALTDSAGPASVTSTGMAIGTPAYMAPEQAAADPAVDHRADLYAFGVTAYEMLTGSPPFAGGSAAEQLAAHVTRKPEPVAQRRPAIPEALSGLIMQCLEKRPADRPANAGIIVDTLDRLVTTPAATPPVTVRPTRRRRWVAIAAGVLVIATAAWGVAWSRRAPIPTEASVIAIMPMGSPARDTTLERIGRDIAFLLSANLDGQGKLRTADPHTILAQVEQVAPPLERARKVGQMLGARAVLHGSIVHSGERVRVEATLHPVAAGDPLATVAVEAHRDSVSALTDSLSWRLLRQLWRGREAPTPSIAGLTTRSWPALRAFLQGEAAFAALAAPEAEDAFRRAVEADSTFWLAWWRLNEVRIGYLALPSDTAMVRRYRQHRAELPDRERDLVEIEVAMLDPDSVNRMGWHDRMMELLRRYPDYWRGWFRLADQDLHNGYREEGLEIDQVSHAFRRAVSLNPAFVPAWMHVRDRAMFDSAAYFEADSAIRRYSSAPPLPPDSMDMLPRLWRRPDRIDTLPTGVIEVWRRQLIGLLPFNRNWLGGGVFGTPKYFAQVTRGVRGTSDDEAMGLVRAYSHATRGAWDSAVAEARTLPGNLRPLHLYRIAAVGAWIGGHQPADARRMRPEPASIPSETRVEIAWLDGLLAIAARDSVGTASARRSLAATGDSAAPLLARALDLGWQVTYGPNPQVAADSLARLEWSRRYTGRSSAWVVEPSAPVHRLMAARALAAAGDTTGAIHLHSYVDFDPLLAPWGLALLKPYALLERARLHEGQKRMREAKLDYEAFLRHFDTPVASLAGLRRTGEEGYARITAVIRQ